MSSRLSSGVYVPRVTNHDGRAIEDALAPPNLYNRGVQLSDAFVEATFARNHPPLLERLLEGGVAYVVDPQTLRFTTEAFREIRRLVSLPYAPQKPLLPRSMMGSAVKRFAAETLVFQSERGAASYIAPAVPLHDRDLEEWTQLSHDLIRAAADSNGATVPRRDLFAVVAPGRKALKNPRETLAEFGDFAIAGLYVEPLALDPVRDSVEKIVQYLRFMYEAQRLGIPVVASRIGAFGLVLSAMRISFSSGLGEAERSNLAALNRRPKRGEDEKTSRGGRRIYLENLKTTLPAAVVERALKEPGLRSRFVCGLGCCRWAGFEGLGRRARQHYLWTRQHEISQVSELDTVEARLQFVHDRFVEAQGNAATLQRIFEERGVDAPTFEHLDRWAAAVARILQVPVASRDQ